jgi:two-component system, OmpR family, phosphate regulon sensor histidine kinase PhoR
MLFFELALAFLIGAAVASAIAWAWLHEAVVARRRAEDRYAHAAREQEELRQVAERANGRLSALLAAYPRPVFITSRARVILFANEAALALVHLPAEQVIGRRAASILQDYDTMQLLARAARLNQPCERTFQRVTTGQTWRVIATPLRLEEGAPTDLSDAPDIALSIEDLTELRRLETVRRDFVAHVSHELRTPLAAVKLLAETLVNALDRDPPAARGFALRISGEADHLSQMVAELLELSRIESGRIELRQEPTDLAALVEASVERMRPLAAERGVTLEAVPPEEALPDAWCDGERIGEALVNLIHNGIKYTDPGGWVRVSIAVTADHGPPPLSASQPSRPPGVDTSAPRRMLATTVSDNGAGISAEDLPRVFERFFKADRARTRPSSGPIEPQPAPNEPTPISTRRQAKVARGAAGGNGGARSAAIPSSAQPAARTVSASEAIERGGGLQGLAAGGTGLGLAITRHLIELHGGRIRATSRPGHGSQFTFTLPIAEE